MRVFFDAKAQGNRTNIFQGPQVPVTGVVTALNSIAPNYSENWRRIQP
jgi:hypothetical protein